MKYTLYLEMNVYVHSLYECVLCMFTDVAESSTTQSAGNPQLQKLLQRMNIQEYYPRKLSLADIQTNAHRDLQSVEDLPWVILNGLLSVNYKTRDGLVDQINKAQVKQQGTGQGRLGKRKLGIQSTVTNTNAMHPQDIMFALLECCDMLLMQTICQNLKKCRVAIPIITAKHEFLLWSMKNTILEYSKIEGEISERRGVHEQLNIISFLRIGSISQSKSIILNKLIDSTNNTFYNRECPSRQAKRVLANGSVEGVWHLPTPEDPFDPRLLLNIRGDSMQHRHLCPLVGEISSIVIAMVSMEALIHDEGVAYLASILKSSKRAVVLFMKSQSITDDLQREIKILMDNTLEDQDDKVTYLFDYDDNNQQNAIELTEVLSRAISEVSSPQLRSLEELVQTFERQEVNIDEKEPKCVAAQTAIQAVMELILKTDSSDLRLKLPLQGKLSMKLSSLTRTKQARQHQGEETTKCDEEISKIWEQQRVKYAEGGEFIKMVVEVLAKNEIEIVPLMMRILHFVFDDRSMVDRPHLEKAYQQLKGRTSKFDKQRLTEVSRALCGTINVQHLFFEIAQVYEAFITCDNIPKIIEDFPSIVASLILNGAPIELMNGDTSCIPLVWLNSVFSCLQKKLQNGRVLVLGVVGARSSGKSTMLNAMFGLEFNVGTGICTQGVHAQLVKVNRREYPFEHILVLDTEGLQAPELAISDYQRGNEISAFVLALSDISVINIKGENTADMLDMWHTVAQALIKLQWEWQLSMCDRTGIFAYQNITTISAVKRARNNQYMLMDRLDEMTQTAAGQLHDTNTMRFNDLIAFEPENDTWLFPDLLQGHPPNVSVNPDYSATVHKFTRHIKDTGKNITRHRTMEEMFINMKDIWNALVSMDLFNFSSPTL